MAEYMNEMGNIDNVPDFDSYGDPSVLKEVLPEAATESTTEETTEAATEVVSE